MGRASTLRVDTLTSISYWAYKRSWLKFFHEEAKTRPFLHCNSRKSVSAAGCECQCLALSSTSLPPVLPKSFCKGPRV